MIPTRDRAEETDEDRQRPPGEPPAAIIVRFCHDEVVRQISGLRSISSIKTKIKLHFLPADVEFNTFQSKQFNSIFADFHPTKQ